MNNEIQQIATRLDQQSNQGEGGTMKWLFRPLLKMLAEGDPVTIEAIAAATGKPVDEMREVLKTLPSVELNEQGSIVGFGLTLVPTPHRFKVDGKELYTWCALDTLMFPEFIGHKVHIESPCYSTGEPIRLTVESDRVVSLEPTTAVVSIVIPEDMSSVRSSFCNEVHFFRTESAAQDWLDQHPNGKVLPVKEAFELGRLMGKGYEESGPTSGSCCNV
ncbi:organomercurial lyase MerB [Terrihalobacillus insolitus]|uniref:organomercurial lyase MerB n=1 Tax=Terrihalobacillus insolitus TaxID=2950438 RepID=UPI0023405600|nr:organomercurial lyase MerB [Terrihalobacillus insolitus]MDC3415197.1 organomercurial lyase MerB [Terrihalobacillus insolitus]